MRGAFGFDLRSMELFVETLERGSQNEIVVPRPGSLSMSMLPPLCLATPYAIDSPTPLPSQVPA